MPSTVRISETKLVTTLRRKHPGEWIDAFVSYDNGNSWSFLSKVADTFCCNGNPPALVRLVGPRGDGRLCCAYGNRADFRIEARISDDEGATWSEPIVLRDDYQTDAYGDADLGYCRMVQRPDGILVTMYYWATPEHPTHHIAATIWDPRIAIDSLGQAWAPEPADGANDVPPHVVLSWKPGEYAADPNAHDIYFGTDWNDVNHANKSAPQYKGSQNFDVVTYNPGGLELNKTYYWRIDEVNTVNPDSPWKGSVWSFTTANYIVIDDMEAYNYTDNHILLTWIDGTGNLTSSFLDLGIAPTDPIHGGQQSMSYEYYNAIDFGAGYYSEIERQYTYPCDWTARGVKALMLYFYGDPNNDTDDTEQMYVALRDSSNDITVLAYDGDANDVKIRDWQQWDIDLNDFDVNLASVKSVYIGFGDRDNWVLPGGIGLVYFDDIRLYPARCIPEYGPVVDLNDDCVVDYRDLDEMAAQWLHTGEAAADLYDDGIVNLRDFAVLANSWLKEQLWP